MPINSNNLSCPQGDNACQFLAELVELRKEVHFLTEQVRTDALTGLYNFRFFNDTISLEMERARRGVQPLSMILLDIDHFKKFNDQWGHDVGNLALIHIAQLIKIAVRKLDFPCRYGGEEFAILLPNTDLRQAIQVAERLREMIELTPFAADSHTNLNISASLGVDQFVPQQAESSDGFIRRVDALLYDAKHLGRNRVAHPEPAKNILKESVTWEEKNALFDVLSDNENS